MANVIAIIDSGFGDVGKGLMTDYFSSQYDDAIVIRSNGGAQSGHTVVTPDGRNHIFSHFGSGTFNGSPTFLSSFFVNNPILFEKEYKLFTEKFKVKPKIYVDPNSIITTPFDMLLNQRLEAIRGNDIHGSCGVGFGETLERKLIYSSWTMGNLLSAYNASKDSFKNRVYLELTDIREEYVPTRIDMNKVSEEFRLILNSTKLIHDFITACKFMLKHVEIRYPSQFLNNTLIFEGGQGLLLDMDYGYFPHVTRSNCGMKNINSILKNIPGEHDITVNYVTRAYTTRHGAGPLNHENVGDIENRYNIVDNTNITNKFQGSLRFAPLDWDLFFSITDKDFLNYAPRGSKKNIVVTCMDQLKEDVDVIAYLDGKMIEFSKEIFEARMNKTANYLSYGPTRKDVITTSKEK